MKSSRKAREMALQILFQKDFHENSNPRDLFNSFADNFSFDPPTRDYSLFLVTSVLENDEEISSIIAKHSDNWRLDRMSSIDRILLKMATFEICLSTQTETAPKLCIIDTLDLAKKYSSHESKNFINGILDQIFNSESISTSS
ncbi:MAG: transcription antitermination factor NusB [Pseudomonadota bacterium]